MNILIINQFAASDSNGFQQERHIFIAKELVSLGHTVSLVAARYHHYIDELEAKKSLHEEYIYGFKFIRLNLLP